MSGFVFTRPGPYRVQAVYDGEFDAGPIRPYIRRVPRTLLMPIRLLEWILHIDILGRDDFPEAYRVHGESAMLTFQANP